MQRRSFGNTDLSASLIGFGAWGIGGPSMAGDIPIGWGAVNDSVSQQALLTALEQGVNFFDTADFYGLGHSEELIGEVIGSRPDTLIATKVGHRLQEDQSIQLDYSKKHIIRACEASLKRLRRDTIDYYQLHSAKLSHLQQGDCIEAMELLKEQGKIRYWGLSLNTYTPYPEAEYMMDRNIGDGFQLVFNIINQRARDLLQRCQKNGYGIIARMPLQFGLLTGKFSKKSQFPKNDHRHGRLNPAVLDRALTDLEPVWRIAKHYNIPKAAFSLSFIASFPHISTIIPGIKTPEQAIRNTSNLVSLDPDDRDALITLYDQKLAHLLSFMETHG